MSNTLAIAAVTSALRDLINRVADPLPGDPSPDTDLAGSFCSTKPPDKAGKPEGENHLNLFLYQVMHNPALRNLPVPMLSKPGELAEPPLALNLYYLLSAYGKSDDELLSQRLLGRAMALVNDNASLPPRLFDNALRIANVARQVERVRVTPHALSGEEISKLWTVFQTPYRLSVAFQVSVVLIESVKPNHPALPVLVRGPRDPAEIATGPLEDRSGPMVLPGLMPPFPELESLALPIPIQPAARLGPPAGTGDVVTLQGVHLDGSTVQARFRHAVLNAPQSLPALAGATASSFRVQLPNDQDNWPTGLYGVSAFIQRVGEPDRTTNALPLAVAPRITAATAGPRDAQGRSTVTLTVSPKVWPEQRASLLINGIEAVAPARTTKLTSFSFLVPLPPGQHWIRFRVDGVDSFLINLAATPPAFDTTQKVVVPP